MIPFHVFIYSKDGWPIDQICLIIRGLLLEG